MVNATLFLVKQMDLQCFQCECQFGNRAFCEWRHQYCGMFGCIWLAQLISLKITS